MKRRILVGSFLVNVVVVVLLPLFSLPSRIAFQFGSDGLPVFWAPKVGFMLVLFVLELSLFLLFLFADELIVKSPVKLIQIPNKEYWLKEENIPAFKDKTMNLMCEMGTATFAVIMTFMLWIYNGNSRTPVHVEWEEVYVLFIIYGLYLIYWGIKYISSYRIPEKTELVGKDTL